jgi:organic hydroperoxide reductase OsmC/OhrA
MSIARERNIVKRIRNLFMPRLGGELPEQAFASSLASCSHFHM